MVSRKIQTKILSALPRAHPTIWSARLVAFFLFFLALIMRRSVAALLGYNVLKHLLPPPNGKLIDDITDILPEREFQIAEGVDSFQSVMLIDSFLVTALYVPTMICNKEAAILYSSEKEKKDFERGLDLAGKFDSLSRQQMVDEGFVLGGYMTILRLRSNKLLIYNPVRMTRRAVEFIANLGGEVEYVVSPSSGHTLWIASALEQYPMAKLIAGQSACDKLIKLGVKPCYIYTNTSDLATLTDTLSKEGVTPYPLKGDPAEILFLLHQDSHTLLECDVMYKNAFKPPATTGLPTGNTSNR
jgi:hypothetical protein